MCVGLGRRGGHAAGAEVDVDVEAAGAAVASVDIAARVRSRWG